MKILLCLFILTLVSCFNKANVPSKVETCIKDTKTQECTNQITVTHVVTIELPVALVNDCIDKYKDLPEPDKTIQTEACTAAYIQNLIDLIGGLTPQDIPANP